MFARRPLISLLLALCLLLSQQEALAHAIFHLGEQLGAQGHAKPVEVGALDGGGDASDFCPGCLAFAQVAAGAPGSVAILVAAPPALAASVAPACGRLGLPLFSFLARAPPPIL